MATELLEAEERRCAPPPFPFVARCYIAPYQPLAQSEGMVCCRNCYEQSELQVLNPVKSRLKRGDKVEFNRV